MKFDRRKQAGYTSVLAIVDRSGGLDANSPFNAFDVCDRSWIGAVDSVWFDAWVTLVVEVESDTAGLLLAGSRANEGVISADSFVSQVRCGLTRTVEVPERNGVAGWSDCVI